MPQSGDKCSKTYSSNSKIIIFKFINFNSINAFIGFYYNVIIAYCIYYFLFSLRAKLLWADCPPGVIECFQRNSSINNCTIEKAPYDEKNSNI